MNNLSLFLLGLALINVPVCLSKKDKECFSLPDYPCCTGNKIVYSDASGDWGIENGKWCGIGTSDDSCFSIYLGYPCCLGNNVVYTDENGNWGIENNDWCGIDTPKETCFSTSLGYPCCESCEVSYTDESGEWGIENDQWCGIKDECTVVPVPKVSDFDFTFLKMENKKENMLYSPLSIKYALKMLEEGASNNTLTEIQNVLGNTKLSKYEGIDKVLSLADGLFIRDTFYEYVKPEYINTLKEKYNSEVIEDKFEDATNANQWIEDKTMGIIKDMLKDDLVQNPLTVMLIINALAIDMEWASQFSYQSTYGREFYLESGEKVKATTMYKDEVKSKDISYYINDDITVVNMNLKDYDGVQFEFMAIMPKENLSDYVEKVSTEEMNQIEKKLISSVDTLDGVDLFIPKFKFNYDLKLKDDLKNLGIKDAFDKNMADFSKIADEGGLIQKPYVTDALHTADIEFTEKGVKAAAVTVVSVGGITAPPPEVTYPVEIRINKPFMFVIKEKNTKEIWFTGTVYEPSLWENDEELYETPLYGGYCFSLSQGYPCCNSCITIYTERNGDAWGIENGDFCGINPRCRLNPQPDDSDFDFSFLKMENKNKKENMIYSPLSIKYALKMLEEGANNNTLTEIQNVLGNTKLSKYESIDDILSFANGLFVRDTFSKYVKPEYINKLKKQYNTEVVEDEFKDAKNANQWIEGKTMGIIKDMLKDQDVQDPLSVMLIINSLAIEMEWALPFNFKNTIGSYFHYDNGKMEKVTTMQKGFTADKAVSLYEDDNIKVLCMDLKEYNGVQFEFMVLLPEKDLSDFITKVSKKYLKEIDKRLQSTTDGIAANIEMPKFKFNYDLNLKDDLMNLGIKDAFDKDKADFSNIADSDELTQKPYVANALHKADIVLTEKGVKSAAVSIIQATGAAAKPVTKYDYYLSFYINKPFMFVIREKKTKDIWFTGTVYEPDLWENDMASYGRTF